MPETESELLTTQQSDQVRIVRRKHRVGFKCDQTVQYMLDTLKEVPYDATIDEIELHLCDDNYILTIEFHHERVEKNLE